MKFLKHFCSSCFTIKRLKVFIKSLKHFEATIPEMQESPKIKIQLYIKKTNSSFSKYLIFFIFFFFETLEEIKGNSRILSFFRKVLMFSKNWISNWRKQSPSTNQPLNKVSLPSTRRNSPYFRRRVIEENYLPHQHSKSQCVLCNCVLAFLKMRSLTVIAPGNTPNCK